MHTFYLSGSNGYTATNIRFGHSYGYLNTNELWKFEDWMTDLSKENFTLEDKPIEIEINWKGKLTYPEGEDIRGRIREQNPKQKR